MSAFYPFANNIRSTEHILFSLKFFYLVVTLDVDILVPCWLPHRGLPGQPATISTQPGSTTYKEEEKERCDVIII